LVSSFQVHFEPTGHSLRHDAAQHAASGRDVDKKYKDAIKRSIGGHEGDHDGLPSYIIPGTPEEKRWRETHPDLGLMVKDETFATGSTPAHRHAQIGNTKELELYIKANKNAVNARDANGWTPLVESARGGHLEAVKLLVEHGAELDVKTYGRGGTALWWAKQTHEEDHPVIEFLESIGALDAGPEL
jgi:prolyl 4-hydroxylase